MTSSAASDIGSFIEGWVPMALIGLATIIGSAAFFFGLDWYSRKASYRELAQLYTHSSAFWARWPGDRLWSAPYDELAAEANRCDELIRSVGDKRLYVGRKKGLTKKQAEGLLAEFRVQIDREIAAYQGMLAAVRNAMSYAVSQGRGP
ncbi:hypothetical protein A5719_07680 [Mycolicibacterium peregrinum]|uniref:hypothetical protein n=1 Tax=Mycolicibacterium peregrinum TaxID=43304 RepID=UPI0007EAB8AF|nr:hypothetical protein [Mycolicibacterium peregrinum]OBF44338.1 hypothetical protein A5719_07680 [Mycolicibacterium peregrinum]